MANNMSDNGKFICYVCRATVIQTNTDEEAMAEMRKRYLDHEIERQGTVEMCETCAARFKEWLADQEQPIAN